MSDEGIRPVPASCKVHIPFVGLRRDEWGRLGLIALAFGYLCFLAWQAATRGFFEYVAVDFRSFYATAEIIRDHGVAGIYDLSLQAQYQRPLFDAYATASEGLPFAPAPVPYPAPFMVALLPLLLIPPLVGYFVSAAVNGIVTLFYLRRLAKAAGLRTTRTFSVQLFLCLPIFLTMFFGQLNAWLLIALGESLIHFRKGREVWGGAWLAGLLLKPQTLILLVPGLVIGRQWRALAGFIAASAAIGLLSFLLVGADGLMSMVRLWLNYPGSTMPMVFAQGMMNWRAFAVNFEGLVDDTVIWSIAYVGLALTFLAALSLWLPRPIPSSRTFIPVLAGTYAATCAVAWHSHVHMALPLLAPLVFFQADQALPRALKLWLWVPPIIFLGFAFLAGPGYAHSIAGLSLFIINLMVLNWAYREVRRTAHDTKPAFSVGTSNATAP